MAICKFYQRGNCWYGENCRNEHPRNTSGFGGGNRFGVLQQGGSGSGGGRFDATRQSQEPENKYGASKADIKNDLTAGKNRPMWIFSCYAPAKNVPIHLFGGPQRELSFEEMRAAHYSAVASGTAEKAIQEASNMYAEAEQQMKVILNDLDGAIKYLINGELEHPNRFDIVEGKTGTGPAFSKGPTGQPPQPPQPPQAAQSSPFGQPSTSSNAPSFGQPAFGQPSSFGQPTPIGGSKPGFGQSGFPQAQQGGVGLGQPTPSPFGQASNQNQAGGFGQFSNQSAPGGGFGQLASGASPFTQSKPAASPFGQPAAAAPTAPAPSPFGQPAAPTAPAASPFGQAAPAAPAAGPFGTASTPSSTPFGQPAPFQSAAAPASTAQQPTSAETQKTGFSRIIEKKLSGMPNLTGQTVRDPATNKLRAWKGQPVTYVSDDNPCYAHPQDPTVLVHIFFPDGPPLATTLKDAQAKDVEYTPEVEEAYKFAKQHGQFKDGVIPSVPPKNEWCSFDF